MNKQSKAVRRVKLHKKERVEREERLKRHNAKLGLLRDLLREREKREEWGEAAQLKPRIRTLEQQIRYMRGDC